MRTPPNIALLSRYNPNRRAVSQLGLLGAASQSYLSQAQVAVAQSRVTGIPPIIADINGTVTVTGSNPGTSISNQVAFSAAMSAPTAAESALSTALADAAAAIAQFHSNPNLATNSTAYLDPTMVDNDAAPPAAPSYIPLPPYPYASFGAAIDFPYATPAPHWTTNLKWWTGQTILNVGAPQYSNDPWDYLRSALVDSNMGMLVNWCNWYTYALGRPAGAALGGAASPWVLALSQVDLARFKYTMTADGALFFPFSYADLTAIQTATKGFEYGMSASDLATWLATWVSNSLPHIDDFPEGMRLEPSTVTPYFSPVNIPALYRKGSTFLAAALPYIPVLSVIAGGVLAFVLAPAAAAGGAAAAAAADTSTVAAFTSGAAQLANQAAASAAAAAAAVAAAAPIAAVVAPIATVAVDTSAAAADVGLEVLDPIIVTATPISVLTAGTAAGAAVTAAASAGAAALTATDAPTESDPLDEITVTAPPFIPPSIPVIALPDIAAGLTPAIAAITANIPTYNAPATNSYNPLTSPSSLATLASGIGKVISSLFGGGSALAAAGTGAGQTGTTGSAGDTGILGLSSEELLLLVIAAGAGLVLMSSKPKRKTHHHAHAK